MKKIVVGRIANIYIEIRSLARGFINIDSRPRRKYVGLVRILYGRKKKFKITKGRMEESLV